MMENPPYFDISSSLASASVALHNFGGKFSERVAIFRRADSHEKVDTTLWHGERELEDGTRVWVFQVPGSLFDAIQLAMTKIMERWRDQLEIEDLDRFLAIEQSHHLLDLEEDEIRELRAGFVNLAGTVAYGPATAERTVSS